MSVVCVNLNSPEVKKLSGELGIHPSSLEVCIHEYWNSPYGQRYFDVHGDYPFPGTEYVKEYFFGGNNHTGAEAIKAWARTAGSHHYGELYNGSREYIEKDIREYTPIVGREAIHIYRGVDGSTVFKVARPKLRNVQELQLLLSELGLIHKWGSKKWRLTKSAKLSDRSVQDSFRAAIKVLNLDESLFTFTKEGSTTVVNFKPDFNEFTESTYSNNGLLFQKSDYLEQLNALRAYSNPLVGRGSLSKVIDYIKSMKGVDTLIKTTLIKAIQTDPSLTRLSPYTLWNIIVKQREQGIATEYNKYIQQPIDEALEKHLTEYLKPYGIDIKESGVAEQYGVAGVYDIINKVIHLAKNRNSLTLTEEFAHAFVELMGSVVSNREENQDYTFLFEHVEGTDIFKQVFEEYKGTYLKEDGTPDIDKIKKEAIGQALAVAINNKWNNKVSEAESSFWTRLKEWLNKILDKFQNSEYINFESLTNKIASEIVDKDYSRLHKVDNSKYSVLNYADTLATQNKKDGGKAVGMMQYFSSIGNIITGSLSYRMQGTVYRGSADALHDIDMKVPLSVHGMDLNDSIIRGIISRAKRTNKDLINILLRTPYFTKVIEKYPKMKFFTAYGSQDDLKVTISAVYSEDESLSQRFMSLNGSYAKRLEAFTEEERNKLYLFDFFLEDTDLPYIYDEANKLALAKYENSFKAKLEMGRAKDIFDYQMFNIFEEFKSPYTSPMEHLMLQKSKIPFTVKQKEVIQGVKDYLLDPNETSEFCVIEGVAGSGKTTIVNEILNQVKESCEADGKKLPNISVGAVANKAVEVIASKIDVPITAGSCASILGLQEKRIWNPITDTVVEKWVKPKPKRGEEAAIFGKRFGGTEILIVDECSMLNETQLEYFKLAKKLYEKKNKGKKLKIVFIGDPRQAPAIREAIRNSKGVNQDAPSPTFTTENSIKFTLEERVRQGNSSPVPAFSDIMGNWSIQEKLEELAQKSRAAFVKGAAEMFSKIQNSSSILSEGGALCLYNDTSVGPSNKILELALPIYRQMLVSGNLNLGKIVCAHVSAVMRYNEMIQKKLHPDSFNRINEGDPVMFYVPYIINAELGEVINNSHEAFTREVSEVMEDNFESVQSFMESRYKDTFKRVPPIKYQMVTVDYKFQKQTKSIRLKMVVPTTENLQNFEKLRWAVAEKQGKEFSFGGDSEAGRTLQVFEKEIDKIANVQFDYAISAHKSQGSTYDTVIVDSADIMGRRMPNGKGGIAGGFSAIAQAKLLYTAITRASNVTMMVGDFPKANSPMDTPVNINNRIRQFKGLPIESASSTTRDTNRPNPSKPISATVDKMEKALKPWEEIFKDIDSHNEKIDNDIEHSYYYYPNGKENPKGKVKVDTSVTTLVNPVKQENPWLPIASKLGTTTDGILRDYFDGIDITSKNYPNYTSTQIASLKEDLDKLKEEFDKIVGNKQYKVISTEHPLIAKYIDEKGQTKTVGGTIDLLIVDEDGNYYIYDVKTSRSSISTDSNKVHHYTSQVNFYREILEANYPQLKGRCKGLGIVELNLSYPAPKGTTLKGGVPGQASYTFNGLQVKLQGVDIQDYVGKFRYIAPRLASTPTISVEERTPDRVISSVDRMETYAPITILPYSSPKTFVFETPNEAPSNGSNSTNTQRTTVSTKTVTTAPTVNYYEDPSALADLETEGEDEELDLFGSNDEPQSTTVPVQSTTPATISFADYADNPSALAGIEGEDEELDLFGSSSVTEVPASSQTSGEVLSNLQHFVEIYTASRQTFENEPNEVAKLPLAEKLRQLSSFTSKVASGVSDFNRTKDSLSNPNITSVVQNFENAAIDLAYAVVHVNRLRTSLIENGINLKKFEEPSLSVPTLAQQGQVDTDNTNATEQLGSETNINIYAGTGENADLSNFAERPFTDGKYSFISVEQGFQYMKFELLAEFLKKDFKNYSALPSTLNQIEVIKQQILQEKRGASLKQLGRTKLSSTNTEIQDFIDTWFSPNVIKTGVVQAGLRWDGTAGAPGYSSAIMKQLLMESFKQNPQALQRLLDTGNATLTHTQDKGKWGTEFPKLLMEVREELRSSAEVKSQNKAEEVKSETVSPATPVQKELALDSRYKVLGNNTSFKSTVEALTKAGYQVTVVNKMTKDGKGSNMALLISIKGHPEKGWFELVADRDIINGRYAGYNGQYSLHFKTKSKKANNDSDTATVPLEDNEKEALFNALIWAIPQGAKAISTWGTLSKGGVRALESLAKRSNGVLYKVGTRTLKDKKGNNIEVPVYAKTLNPPSNFGVTPIYKVQRGADPNGRLAFSNMTISNNGKYTYNISVYPDVLSVDSFFDYIKGIQESPSSKQKKEVFKRLESMGYTEDYLRAMLRNKQELVAFLVFHEKSHIQHNDFSTYYSQDPQHTLMSEHQIEIETRATVDAIREFEEWKKTPQGKQANPKITISSTFYTKETPLKHPSTGIIFTENAQFAMSMTGQKLPEGIPAVTANTLNVSAGKSGTNQAVIRTDSAGNPYPNTSGIVVKKAALIGGQWVMNEGNFQDTEEDFELFKTQNYKAFAKVGKFSEIMWPTQVALGKAALPLRFAEWLQKELFTKFGIETTVEENHKFGQNGYGLKIGDTIGTIEAPAELVIAPSIEGKSASQACAVHAAKIKGVNTLRGYNSAHFGNPFSVKSYPGVQRILGSVDECVKAFEEWLRGTNYQEVEPARRQWILQQINSGNLDGKPLVYYTTTVDSQDGKDYFGHPSNATEQYDYVTRPNHAHILAKLIYEHQQGRIIGKNKAKPQGAVASEHPMTPSQFTNYSGGAYGGDTIWDTVGRNAGFTQHIHYSTGNSRVSSSSLRNNGVKGVELTRAQYDEAARFMSQLLRMAIEPKNIPGQTEKDYDSTQKLMLRDYWQAKNADAVFALAPIENNKVKGGTRHAVSCAIAMNKNVFVWDTNTRGWFMYDRAKHTYVSCDTPILTTKYAGVGSRSLENYTKRGADGTFKSTKELGEYLGEEIEAAARQAVLDVFTKTLNQPKQLVAKYGQDQIDKAAEILNSDDQFFNEQEKKEVEKALPKKIVKVVAASEHSDPVLHAEEVKAFIQPEIDKKQARIRINEALKTATTEEEKQALKQQLDAIGEPKFNVMYLITKHDGLPLRELAQLDIPKFVHFSITGLGSTDWEPGVMKPDDLLDRIEEFLREGVLDKNKTFIRIDPIVPGVTDPAMVKHIMERASSMGIKTIRFSIMDSYGYTDGGERDRKIISSVNERIKNYDWEKYYGYETSGKNKGKVRYEAKPEYIKQWFDIMHANAEEFDLHLEVCDEKIPGYYPRINRGKHCINSEIIQNAIGDQGVDAEPGKFNRPGCGCKASTDALASDASCGSSCVYCYKAHSVDESLNYYNEDGTLKSTGLYERLTLVSPNTKSQEEVNDDQDSLLDSIIARAERRVAQSVHNEAPVNPNTLYKPYELQLIRQRKALAEASMSVIKPTELRNLAKICMFQLSDAITKLVSTDDYAQTFFPEGSKWRDKSFKGYERIDLIREIGLNTLLDAVKENYFTLQSLKERGGKPTLGIKKKFALIKDNWSAFIEMAYGALSDIESVAVTSMSLDQTSTKALRVLNSGEEELFEGQSAQEIAESLGSSLEHWQIGFRQLSAFSSLSKMLKVYINTIKEVDIDGNDLLDNTYKLPMRMDAGKAVANILMWTQGASTLSEMVEALRTQQQAHPWLGKLIEDLTGDNYTFQSQFFSNFKKYFQPYQIQYIDKKTGRLTMKIINAGSLEKELAQQWADNWKARLDEKQNNIWEQEHIKPMALYLQDGTLDIATVGTEKNPAKGSLTWAVQTLKPFSAKIRENRQGFNPTKEDSELILSAIKAIYKAFDVNLDDQADAQLLQKLQDPQNIDALYTNTVYLAKHLRDNISKKDYNPYVEQDRKNIEFLFSLVADYSEVNLESVSYENGKMHYSYVIPSYLSKLLGKIQGHVSDYDQFLEQEYGQYPWFKKGKKWRPEWLNLIVNDEKKRAQFTHAVLLSQETKKGSKLGYTEKSPVSYSRSMLANYFYADSNNSITEEVPLSQEELNKSYESALREQAQKLKAIGAPGTEQEIMQKIHQDIVNGKNPGVTWQTTKKVTRSIVKSGEYAYYHIPMMSNKPSEEYIHFVKYGTSTPDWKATITKHLLSVAEQEIDRIATAELRALDPDTAEIKSFDYDKKKGKKGNAQKFVFLEYLQPTLEAYDEWASDQKAAGKPATYDELIQNHSDQQDLLLGYLLRAKIEEAKSGRPLMAPLQQKFNELMLGSSSAKGAIEKGMDARYQEYIEFLTKEGMITKKNNKLNYSNFQGLNMGTNEQEILANLENFFWNDAFASINILQLTVTDIAFYKDTEDLQKRLAQIHAPGLRANIQAKDANGNYVALESGGRAFERTIYLTDLDGIVSDAVENVRAILEARYNEMPEQTEEEKNRKAEYKEVITDLVEQFKSINVADAQGYSCLTSYRKKAIMFGKWEAQNEEMWQSMQEGWYKDARMLSVAMQPLKPFIYSQTPKESVGPLSTIKEGVQNKNSEYLLMMMDAILKGEGKSGSCMLSAINEIMEESHQVSRQGDHYVAGTGGIDTVQFESTVKAGLQGRIDISPAALRKWEKTSGNISKWESSHKDWINSKEGKKWRQDNPGHPIPDTEIAKQIIRDAIYVEGNPRLGYNSKTVHALDYEDYCLQSEVPAHLEGESIFGSQLRILGIADTPETDAQGNPNYIKVGNKTITVREAKKQYMTAIRKNIQDSMDTLKEELGLNDPSISQAERNKKLSDLLVKQIKEDNKDGIDLLYAVTTDEQGNFLLPLSDPIMATRVQQLLNSIIKARINKQQMKGGPVVQVTNFGTGSSLQIRFQNSKGEELKTFKEFFEESIKNPAKYPYLQQIIELDDTSEGTPNNTNKFWAKYFKASEKAKQARRKVTAPITWDEFIQYAKGEHKGSTEYKQIYAPMQEAYQQYLKDQDASIKYFECYAPSKVFADEFPDAVDKHGNVNIDWFKQNGREDALQMIGYRIPTESKYSMAPLKIVGFLPYEAGEGIMLPKDITLLSGSDFDIDKMYIVRQEIDAILDKDAARAAFKKEGNYFGPDKDIYDTKTIWDTIYEENPEAQESILETQKKWYNKYTDEGGTLPFEEAIQHPKLTGKKNQTDWLTSEEKQYYWNKFFEEHSKEDYVEKDGNRVYWNDWFTQNKGRFIRYERPSDMESRHGRNNIIFDTLWGSLTNSLSAAQIFTPGNFDQPKKYGYMAAVLESFTLEQLQQHIKNSMSESFWQQHKNDDLYTLVDSLDTDTLKSLLSSSKNLVYNHTHLQFHKQNMVAGKLIGIFAQNNVSHSVISFEDYIEKSEDGTIREVYPKIILSVDDALTIEGEFLSDEVEYDRMYNKYGSRISSTLAAFLAASVDAVKDPVLNYMNVNETTAGVLTTLVRLGYDTELAMMLLSRPVIKKLVQTYVTLNETNEVSMQDVAKQLLKENGSDGSLEPEASISKDYLKQLINEDREGQSVEDNRNLITAFMKLYDISRTTSNIVALTKFNSVTSAIGPLITDTMQMQFKVEDALTDPRLQESVMQRAINNEIPLAFREATIGYATKIGNHSIEFNGGLHQELFYGKFITASEGFYDATRILEQFISGTFASASKIPLLNKFSDFYIAWVLNSNIDKDDALFQTSDNSAPLSATRRAELLRKLPNKVKELQKTSKNPLIKAIQIKGQDNTHTFNWMTINTRAYLSDQIDDLKAAWYELYMGSEEEKQLAMDLIEYNYLIDCFGFSPVSFSKLIPIQLRNKIPNYVDKLRKSINSTNSINYAQLIDQFIRNNHNMKELVYTVQQGVYQERSNNRVGINLDLCPYILRDGNRNQPREFVKMPDGRLMKVVRTDSNNMYSEAQILNNYVIYREVTTLGGENGELIEFNPNGEAETIFTDKERTHLREHSTIRGTQTVRSVAYNTAQQLEYFLLTHIDSSMRNQKIQQIQESLQSKDDAQIQKTLAEILLSGRCGSIDNFTKNMADTKQALFQVVSYFQSETDKKQPLEVQKLINGIQTTQQQLKICK